MIWRRKVFEYGEGSLSKDDGDCDRADFFCLGLLTALPIYLSPTIKVFINV